MSQPIDMHRGADGVYRPKADGLAGVLDDLEAGIDAADGIAGAVEEYAERLSVVMARRRILRSPRGRGPQRAERIEE